MASKRTLKAERVTTLMGKLFPLWFCCCLVIWTDPSSRTTPTPESESAHHLSRTSSIRSAAGLASSASAIPNLASTESTNGSQQPQFIKAEVGFGPLSGEDQLKSSLKGKDRIFLLVLAKEIEAFIEKVALGQECHIIPSIPLATNSTSVLASMSASFAVASHISSTFQRMLVYKLAEWYGLKAVNTPEVSMLVGVIGTMNPQSRGLKLSDLAPRADTPPQKFRIMQRAQPNSSNSSDANGISRASSIGLEDAGSETSSSKVRTLEEREAAYNKARQRIYGATNGSDGALDTTTAPTATIRGPRPVQDVSDDYETAPRQPTVVSEPTFQPVFPSLYDPPKTTTNGVAGPSSQSYDPPTSYQHDNMRQHYPPQSQVQMQIPSYMPNYQQQSGYQPEYAHGPQQQYGMPPYMAQGNPYGMPQHANNGYPNQWGQSQQHPHQQQQHHHHHQQQQPAYGRQHQQMPPNQAMPHGWMQPNHGQGSSQGQGPMPMPNQPMPMIPQGMQYPGAYGHPPQQQVYPPLMQPTPTRPAVHPHSSASSSISSRSYQSYHDGSRPHSRGSTTSNMSATSSVRFGAMYPANQGGGYRQKGIKGQGMNGMNALPGFGTSSEKRSTRAHSPVSPYSLPFHCIWSDMISHRLQPHHPDHHVKLEVSVLSHHLNIHYLNDPIGRPITSHTRSLLSTEMVQPTRMVHLARTISLRWLGMVMAIREHMPNRCRSNVPNRVRADHQPGTVLDLNHSVKSVAHHRHPLPMKCHLHHPGRRCYVPQVHWSRLRKPQLAFRRFRPQVPNATRTVRRTTRMISHVGRHQ